MTALEKSILATLVYFDALERPLTGWEIWRYLISPRSDARLIVFDNRLNTILDVLENSHALSKLINQQNGFYFLKNRQELVKKRIERQKIADQKWKKIKGLIKFLQIVPYLRFVAISGSLAINNTKSDSDIDLLIVVENGRIWTARLLVTGLIHLTGWRKRGQVRQDGICLNHYLADKTLEIKFQSLYTAQICSHLIPFIDKANISQKFCLENNWVSKYFYLYNARQGQNLKTVSNNMLFTTMAQIGELFLDTPLGNWLEKTFKKWQLRHIIKTDYQYKKRMKATGRKLAPGRIIADDSQLEFHPDSPESRIIDKYNQKMEELGLPQMACQKYSGLNWSSS